MKSEKNRELRQMMKDAGLQYKDFAKIMNVSVATAFRILASDLEPEDEQRITEIINAYKEGKTCSQKN